MRIGELSKLSGCSIQTIRYYEKEKLLPLPFRSEGNFRLYNQESLEQLLFIKHCRSLDITLKEIKQLLELKNTPKSDCTDISKIIEIHINLVNLRIEELKILKSNLLSLYQKCPSGGVIQDCEILKGLTKI